MTTNNMTELTRFRADLARSLARRGTRLLEAADQAREVAVLEPLEAYFITKELGLDHARPIIMHFSEEQLQACIDLSCWHNNDFQTTELADWLTAYAEEGGTALAHAFFSMDIEVQVLFLAQTLTIYSFEDDQIPEYDPECQLRAVTPDSLYLLEVKGDRSMPLNPLGLVGALYQYDAERAGHLMTDVRWELPSQLEEDALRFRSGRMHELGFVPPDEAAILFTPPRNQPPPLHAEPLESAATRLPALYAGLMVVPTLLSQALALITDPPFLSRLEQELVWTINSAIVAYGESPQDVAHVAVIALRVRDTISLGLESLLQRDGLNLQHDGDKALEQAVRHMQRWGLRDLFRHGYAASLALQQEIKQIMRRPQVLAWYDLPEMQRPDEPGDRLDYAFVSALLGRHPQLAGFDPDKPERVRPLASLADLTAVQARLERLAARLA